MDQNKSGKFIAKLRKEKNMTQEQLAEKMGVSINAVSRWERGLSFPDVSLYRKLCKELDINIEELINGEKDKSEEAKEKAIISTIKETNKIKNNSKKLITILSIFFVIMFCGLIYYNSNLKINLVNDSDYLYDEVIDFLRNEEFETNEDAKNKDFNTFYSYHGFGIEKNNEYKYVYMWVTNESYYIEEDEGLASSCGSSVPLKATFKNNKLENIPYPNDGNLYESSIKDMFKGVIRTQVLSYNNQKNIDKLFNDIENKKNKYYNYLNLDMNLLTIDDLSYNNLVFSIELRNKNCNIPVLLNVYKDNKYKLFTTYKTCKPGKICTSDLRYIDSVSGTYDYDILEIIKHSEDANLFQYNSESNSMYEIYSGKSHPFVTDDNNKYLKEFLELINVNLKQCANAKYED